MHPCQLPADIVERMITRRGHLHLFRTLDPARTALVVIDMQNAFLQPGAPSETPVAREIVPNIDPARPGGARWWWRSGIRPRIVPAEGAGCLGPCFLTTW